jgi:hypothetical protein
MAQFIYFQQAFHQPPPARSSLRQGLNQHLPAGKYRADARQAMPVFWPSLFAFPSDIHCCKLFNEHADIKIEASWHPGAQHGSQL